MHGVKIDEIFCYDQILNTNCGFWSSLADHFKTLVNFDDKRPRFWMFAEGSDI